MGDRPSVGALRVPAISSRRVRRSAEARFDLFKDGFMSEGVTKGPCD